MKKHRVCSFRSSRSCSRRGLFGFQEQTIGDGAAAFLLGKEDVIAEIQGVYSVSDELTGTWRSDGDAFVRFWEDRMIQDEGYAPVLTEAINGIMKRCGLEPKDFAKAVVDCPGDQEGSSGKECRSRPSRASLKTRVTIPCMIRPNPGTFVSNRQRHVICVPFPVGAKRTSPR